MRKFFKRLFITLFLLGALGTITVIAFNLLTHATYAARMYDYPSSKNLRISSNTKFTCLFLLVVIGLDRTLSLACSIPL